MRVVLCTVLLLLSSPCLAGMIIGHASVIDGDTIEIGGKSIRLFGIDAPGESQTCTDASGRLYRCGQWAARVLDYRISGNVVYCDPQDSDRPGHAVAICRAWGEDLSAWMVGLGWALADREVSTRYVPAENLARARRAGMWAGEFAPSWE